MREHRDRAIVVGLIRILVDQFVELWTRRHCVQEQDKTHQQRGDDRLAAQLEMAFYKLQIGCKLAPAVPDASDISAFA